MNYNHYVKSDYYSYLSSGIEAWTLLLPVSLGLNRGDTVSVYEVDSSLEPTGRVSVGAVKWGVNNGLEVTNQQSIFYYITNVSNIMAFQSLKFTVSQTGTNDPILTILENTTGGSITAGYDDVGVYDFDGFSAPDASKIICNVGTPYQDPWIVYVVPRSGGHSLQIFSFSSHGNPSDDILLNYSVDIRIYP